MVKTSSAMSASALERSSFVNSRGSGNMLLVRGSTSWSPKELLELRRRELKRGRRYVDTFGARSLSGTTSPTLWLSVASSASLLVLVGGWSSRSSIAALVIRGEMASELWQGLVQFHRR
ncbi:hypothetical protein PRNP1_015384 [Phytophthora ramorum]